MGGGSHNPDSESDDQPGIPTTSVSGAKSSHAGQAHGNVGQDLGDACSHLDIVRKYWDHGPRRNLYHNDTNPSTRSAPPGAVVCLMENETDMNELEREERSDGKPCHGNRERMDGIELDRNQSRVGDRVHHITHGDRGSEFAEPKMIRNEGRNPGGLGHGCQRPVADAEIASPTRDLHRIEAECREGAQMHRKMRSSSHYHDLADFSGEESECQPGGSRLGPHLPPAGHGHSGRHARHFAGR